MPKTEIFKENVRTLGFRRPKEVVPFEFELNEGVTKDQIDYIYPDCGVCTKVELKGGKIIGTLDISKAKSRYEPGHTPINKIIFVYFKDGRAQFIGHPETKKRIINKRKRFERLTVTAVVQQKA